MCVRVCVCVRVCRGGGARKMMPTESKSAKPWPNLCTTTASDLQRPAIGSAAAGAAAAREDLHGAAVAAGLSGNRPKRESA